MPDYEVVSGKLDAIESELKRIGWWRDEPLPAEMYNFSQAFAMDTMPFQYWLQFILIPRVRGIVESRGDFPRQSNVGAQAIREFDGLDEASELSSLLSDFDSYIKLSSVVPVVAHPSALV